jgi:hypothetical protein
MTGLAERIGPQAAERLISAYGGRRIYVPARARQGHALAELLGGAFADLQAAFAGEQVEVALGKPTGALRAAILAADGSHAAVSRRLGCTRRYVRRVRAEAR